MRQLSLSHKRKCLPQMQIDYSGLVVVFDPEGSAIAKAMNIKEKGRFALKVR
jgi:RNA polymerase subunit RPABC4/transcription elongation factor Spt4